MADGPNVRQSPSPSAILHSHWRDVLDIAWRWPNFSPAEIACRGTAKLLINAPALDKLQALRGRPAVAAMVPAWRSGLATGGLSLGAYWIVIWAMTEAPSPRWPPCGERAFCSRSRCLP